METKEINKEQEKSRLVELLNFYMSGCDRDYAEEMAEYLMAQGVTINAGVPVHCGECEYYNAKKSRCDHPTLDWDVECYDAWLDMDPTDFCSCGIRKEKKQEEEQEGEQEEERKGLKYRDFLSLTDEEIKFIVKDIFDAENVENIQRDRENQKITCDITTGGWSDGETEEFSMTDELTLREPTLTNCGISVNFSINADEATKWRQFCLAKGCSKYLKDNPYIESGNG